MIVEHEPAEHVAGVDLWKVRLDEGTGDTGPRDGLTRQELDRASAMARPEVRRRFLLARQALRAILGRYATLPAAPVDFRFGPAGKPTLPGGPPFSLSHSEDRLLVAVDSRREVGVDLERLRPVAEALDIARRCFDAAEVEALRLAAPSVAPEVFLRSWTRREAYLKALGIGLTGDGARQPVDLDRWEVHDLRPWTGFFGALVVERRP